MASSALHCSSCGKRFEFDRDVGTLRVRCPVCGVLLSSEETPLDSADKRPPDPRLEMTVGGCRIRKRLSAGRASVTYLARHKKLRMLVALEVFPHSRPGYSEQRITELFAQLRQAAALRSPNVVGILDLGRRSDSEFVVKELVDGGSVRRLLDRRGQLRPGEVLPIAEGVLRGLRAAHEHGLTHGGISPDTMLLDYDGMVKLADPGRTPEQEDLAEFIPTGRGGVTGPCFYVAPEQVRDGMGDIRSDLYALGVSLYEMLSGRVPFEGDGPQEIMRKRVEEAPRELRLLAPAVPDELCSFVMRLMAPKPDDRPADPAEALSELEEVAVGLSERGEIRKVAAAITPAESGRRRRLRAVVWMLVGVALITLATVPLMRLLREPRRSGLVGDRVAQSRESSRVLVVITSADAPGTEPLPEAQRRSLLALAQSHVSCCGSLAAINPFATEELAQEGKSVDEMLLALDPDYVLKIRRSPEPASVKWQLSFSRLRGQGWTVAAECATDASADDATAKLNEALSELLGKVALRLGDAGSGPVRYEPYTAGWADPKLWEAVGTAVVSERAGRWGEARAALAAAMPQAEHPAMLEVLDAFYAMAASRQEGNGVGAPPAIRGEELKGEFARLAVALDAIREGSPEAVDKALGSYAAAFPRSARCHFLVGLWRIRIGAATDEALAAFWRAVECDSGYLPAAFAAADIIALRGQDGLDAFMERYRALAHTEDKATALALHCSALKNPKQAE